MSTIFVVGGLFPNPLVVTVKLKEPVPSADFFGATNTLIGTGVSPSTVTEASP